MLFFSNWSSLQDLFSHFLKKGIHCPTQVVVVVVQSALSWATLSKRRRPTGALTYLNYWVSRKMFCELLCKNWSNFLKTCQNEFLIILKGQFLYRKNICELQLQPILLKGFYTSKHYEIFATTSAPNHKKVVWQKREQIQKSPTTAPKILPP